MPSIRSLFEKDVDRLIEGVIKADDERHLATEVEEYVITNEVDKRLGDLLDHYADGEGSNGVWVSGFFGSGKSHLLKMLSLLLQNSTAGDQTVGEHFKSKTDNEFLKGEIERASAIPSQSLLFNIDQKADGIGGKENAALLEVFVKVFNEMQGYYSKQAYVAEFEDQLAKRGELDGFKSTYATVSGRKWEDDLDLIDTLENDTFAKAYADFFDKPLDDGKTYFDRARANYRLSVEDFADRVKAYLDTKPANFRLNFFVDEVGQFIGKNSRLMLNLQTIAETLSTRCDNRAWIFVTSQGDLQAILGGLQDEEGADFSKIQGRFASKVNLSSADVDEVIQKRLLSKAEAQPASLVSLYESEKENLRTLFTFDADSRIFQGFRQTQDFCDYYPFQPYQITLFQTAIERLSQHDAFTGKHASVGERSMLGVFQVVAKHIADAEVGVFATFDLMFEGLKDVLKSEFQRSILTAEKQLKDERPIAVKILKCLFLLKWVTEFKPSVRNVAILLIDRADITIAAHNEAVQKELTYLESQSYLQRDGDLYEFLTDEEKDIEVEIKSTPIDDSAVAKLLGEILFKDVLVDQRIRYEENKQDYSFTRKLDEQAIGKVHDLAIHIVTANHPNAGDVKTLASQNMGRRELVIALPESGRLITDAELYEKTNIYGNRARQSGLSPSKDGIIRERMQQNNLRRSKLREQCKELLTRATFIANGSALEVTGQDPKTRIAKAFQSLISTTYPNLRMLRTTYSEAHVKKILSDSDHLIAGGDESLSEAEQEILNKLKVAKMGGTRTTVEALIQHFSQTSYGWYEMATLALIATLFRRHKIEIRQGSTVLESSDLVTQLINTASQRGIEVEPQEDFSQQDISAVKKFHHDFFDRANSGTDAKSVAKQTLALFREEAANLDSLIASQGRFPFVSVLSDLRTRIAGYADKDFSFILRNFRSFDDLLDAREDYISPIKAFVNGEQGKLYLQIIDFLRDQNANFPPGDPRPAALINLRDSETPYRGGLVKKAKDSYDSLRKDVADSLAAEKEKALAQLASRRTQLEQAEGFASLSADQQQSVTAASDSAVREIENADLIPVISSTLGHYLSATFPQQLGQIASLSQPKPGPDPDPIPSGDGDSPTKAASPAPPAQTHVSLSGLLSQLTYEKTILSSDQDVDAYVATVSAHLKDAIARDQNITL